MVVTVDTLTPATPVLTGLTAATDTGSSNVDGLTSNATPTLTGTAAAGSTTEIADRVVAELEETWPPDRLSDYLDTLGPKETQS